VNILTSKKTPKALQVASTRELENGQSKKFIIQRPDRKTEAFLIKTNDRYYAYLNLCRHWTVGLDFDDNDFFSDGSEWIVCKNHGALYHPVTGQCESGPCGGASLYRVPIVEKNGFLYADLAKINWGEEA
jgi:nitrite reductase/ring-hydroxylating ferredoxin subunit